MSLAFYLPYLASILLSCIMAFIHRKFLHSRHLFILLPFLFYVFTQEIVLSVVDFNNAVVYNIYRPVSVIVFFWIYYNIPFMNPLRQMMLWLTVIYLFFIFCNYCFIESIFDTSSYLTLARGFLITFYAVSFLFRYFNIDDVAEEKYWRPLLWVTAGIAIFYPVVSISLTFQKFLVTENATLFNEKLYRLIPQVMSIFMYSCFSYAFYLCQKIK